MGDEWTCIGHETSEQLAVQQREYYVKVIKCKKYVRNTESDQGTDSGIRVAPVAKIMLPRSLADTSLLADVLCSKFLDAMSFYRIYERLKPLEQLFYRDIGKSPLWHLDETTFSSTTIADVTSRPSRRWRVTISARAQ
jgi:hypothetical protein